MKNVVELNEIKHHFGSIREFMDIHQKTTFSRNFLKKINRIGNSTLDLYYGQLNVKDVKLEVVDYLNQKEISSKSKLRELIGNSDRSYLNITLSDQSEWTIRTINSQSFVHVHPARYSFLSMRCTGPSLKTVIATFCSRGSLSPQLKEINTARQEIKLPPIQKLIKNRGLDKLFKFFLEHQTS